MVCNEAQGVSPPQQGLRKAGICHQGFRTSLASSKHFQSSTLAKAKARLPVPPAKLLLGEDPALCPKPIDWSCQLGVLFHPQGLRLGGEVGEARTPKHRGLDPPKARGLVPIWTLMTSILPGSCVPASHSMRRSKT